MAHRWWVGVVLGLGLLVCTASEVSAEGTVAGPHFSDATLQAFVIAALRVGNLIDSWQPIIDAAPTLEDKARLKQAADARMSVVIKAGSTISVGDYQAVRRRAESDPALQERLSSILQGAVEQR
ncbi:MAG: DUF4168 domain-containing protein [Rhodospirillales bacterium]|nr:DUF4168 domain-containing protein [Rhodospirillales bacterium]